MCTVFAFNMDIILAGGAIGSHTEVVVGPCLLLRVTPPHMMCSDMVNFHQVSVPHASLLILQ
jgi:hypothetical protein